MPQGGTPEIKCNPAALQQHLKNEATLRGRVIGSVPVQKCFVIHITLQYYVLNVLYTVQCTECTILRANRINAQVHVF